MKRVGARGKGKWERISWGQALDEIAAKLLELRNEYGADSVALWNLPASVPPTFGLHNLMTARFRNVWGGVDPVYQYGIDDGPVYAIDYMFGMGSPAISRLAASSAGPNGARTSPNGPSTHPNASSRSRVLHPKCSSSSRTSTATATASPTHRCTSMMTTGGSSRARREAARASTNPLAREAICTWSGCPSGRPSACAAVQTTAPRAIPSRSACTTARRALCLSATSKTSQRRQGHVPPS